MPVYHANIPSTGYTIMFGNLLLVVKNNNVVVSDILIFQKYVISAGAKAHLNGQECLHFQTIIRTVIISNH